MQATRLDVLSASPVQRDFSIAKLQPGAVKNRVSSGEWQARVDLAALYRLVAHFRWSDTIYTHISMRVPGENLFLINPFGYLYEEVTASSLVKVSIDGDVVDDPTGFGVNRAGFVIHGAIHAARHDVSCVLHTHTRAGIAVSAQEDGLLPISQHAACVIGMIGYHDAEGIALRLDEQKRLVENLGTGSILILRNHGILIAGRTPGETFYLTSILERACEAQVAALGGDKRLTTLPDSAIEESRTVIASMDGDFSRDWAAMLRLVERIGSDYKD